MKPGGSTGQQGRLLRVIAFALVLAAPARSEPVRFRLVDLGTLGGENSRALAINRHGQVVGESENAVGEIRAFLWSPGAALRDLGTLGGMSSRAFAINADGLVVGEAENRGGDTGAFSWTAEDGMRALPSTARARYSAALAVNDRGWSAGTLEDDRGVHAVVWRQGDLVFINRLPGAGNIQPLGINNRGDLVGQIQAGAEDDFTSLAFYYPRAADVRSLAEFRLLAPHGGSALDINEEGLIAGAMMPDSARMRAYRSRQGEAPAALDGEDVFFSGAAAVNEAGDVVGSSIESYGLDEAATLWRGGRRYNLNEVTDTTNAWWLIQAADIDDGGRIVGHGLLGESHRAFLLEPMMAP